MQPLSPAAILLFLAAAVPGWCQTAAPGVTPDVQCVLPDDFTTPDNALPHVAAALAKQARLDILALGSGSTVGDTSAASGAAFVHHAPGESFPYRMTEALQAARPDIAFHLTVKGGRNMTAEEMLPVLRQELAAHHYDLVIWQTGTVEAVRGLRPETMHDVLLDGIEAATEAGTDVVIVDPQFSRFLRANTDLGPYQAVLDQIATITSATLFHRFDLTHTWASDGQIDVERVARAARDVTITTLNVCLGRALARFVQVGAGQTAH